jgi:hypothetical protein
MRFYTVAEDDFSYRPCVGDGWRWLMKYRPFICKVPVDEFSQEDETRFDGYQKFAVGRPRFTHLGAIGAAERQISKGRRA